MIQTRHLFPCLILFFGSFCYAEKLPNTSGLSEAFTTKEEKEMGKEFMKEIRRSTTIVNDVVIDDYINHLGNRLVASSFAKNKKFHFFVIDDPAFNAFAGPDAYIGIHSGAIITSNSESELAAVIAHEIAHVSGRHIESLISTAKNTQIAASAGALAAIILAGIANNKTGSDNSPNTVSSQSLGNLANGLLMASAGGAAQHLVNFTREHEIEADNMGMKILYNSGFDPKAMPAVFERMKQKYGETPLEIPRFLLTHPVTNYRIAEAKSRAGQFASKSFLNPETFNLIRARTWALTNKSRNDWFKNPISKLASEYASALNLEEKSEIRNALSIASKLQKDQPNELLFTMLLAELEVKNNQFEQAINLLKTTLSSNSAYYPIIIQYAQTLIMSGHNDMACEFLKEKTRKYQDDSNIYFLLARAYGQNNQKAEAYQARARAYALLGENHQAMVLLKQALKISKLNTTERDIINEKIKQLKETEKRGKL
jgi:beta-barrel assembly-enhancing protease